MCGCRKSAEKLLGARSAARRGAAEGAPRSPQLLRVRRSPGGRSRRWTLPGDTPGAGADRPAPGPVRAEGTGTAVPPPPAPPLQVAAPRGWAVPAGSGHCRGRGGDPAASSPTLPPAPGGCPGQLLTCPPLPPLPGAASAAAPAHKLSSPNFGAGRAGEGPRRQGTPPAPAGGSPRGR